MNRTVIGIVFLLLAATGLAQAAPPLSDREGLWEFSLQTRYTASQDFTGDYNSSLSIEDDLGWGFGFGYNVNQQLNVGFGFTWRSVPYDAKIVNGSDILDTSTYSNWLDTSTIMMTGEYTVLQSRIAPYVSGTIGWTFMDTNIYAGSDYACWWDPWYGYICSDYGTTFGDEAFSYGLGAGLRAELTREAYLRLGYEHGWVDIGSYDGTDMLRVDLGILLN